MADHAVLQRFSPAVREWFATSFPEPTPAQVQGWPPITEGRHTLICAPTGSGKTLTAFLSSIDRLVTSPPPEKARRTRVLYLSPLRGPRLRRREEPPCPAGRHRAGGRAPRAAVHRAGRRRPHRRHQRQGPAGAHPSPTGPPDHDAGEPLPDADVVGPGDAGRRRGGDRGRDPRPRADQAGRPPRALAGAAGGDHEPASPADRPVGHAAAAGGGGALPRWVVGARASRARWRSWTPASASRSRSRWSSRSRTWATWARRRWRCAAARPARPWRRCARASGRASTRGSSSWSWPTAPRSSSATPAAWPSGWPPASTSWPRRRAWTSARPASSSRPTTARWPGSSASSSRTS